MHKENRYNIETVIFEYNKKDKEFEMFLDSIFRDYINNDKLLPDTENKEVVDEDAKEEIEEKTIEFSA